MQLRIKGFCFGAVLLASILYLKAETSSRVFEVYNAANGLADNSAQTIKCTKTGRLVITTMGQINFFDGHQFSYIDPTNENQYPLSSYRGNYHLYFDKYHHLWLKNTHSVTCVNLTTEKFVDSIVDVFNEFGMQKKVNDIFVDNDGVVFLLTDDGLYSVATQKVYKVRPKHNLQDLETNGDKYLLLFYEDGEVDVMEQSTGVVVFTTQSYGREDIKRYGNTSVLCEDGNTYYQLRNGDKEAILQRYDLDRREWKTLLTAPYHLNNLEFKDSVLYVPCEYGYWTYDLTTDKATHYEYLQMMRSKPLYTDMNTMAFDKQGGIWIGTENRGLLYSRPFNIPFKVYSWEDREALEYAKMMDHLPSSQMFRGRYVNCVYRDSRGWRWVGTSSGLLLYKSKDEKLPRVFTLRDGLLNNVIHSIVEDHSHQIWVSTSYGISRLRFNEKGEFCDVLSYDNYDYVPNESFVNGRAMCLGDGTIVMQALDHVIAFNPNKMRTLTSDMGFKLYPKLVKLLVNGTEVKTGENLDGNVILTKALTRTKDINVNYDQNSLSLTFSALNYFRPRQTFYRLRVKEIDNTWKIYTPYNSNGIVDGKGQLHLPLVGLLPGTYTVELQASMSIDDWDTEPYVWQVNVNEPWWRTSAIFLLLGLVLLALFLTNVFFYVRNSKMAARRYGEELNIIKRLKSFVATCYDANGDLLEPTVEEMVSTGEVSNNSLSPEFVDVMSRIMEVVYKKKTGQLSMQMLSSMVNMDLQKFYNLITSNIYKNPRGLVKSVMMKRAEEMLRTSGKDVGEIAKECRFASPNYFIASFYREYQMLPNEYRRKHRSL